MEESRWTHIISALNQIPQGGLILLLKGNNRSKKNSVSELVNEVGSELGIDLKSRQVNGNGRDFAARMKKAIQKRT